MADLHEWSAGELITASKLNEYKEALELAISNFETAQTEMDTEITDLQNDYQSALGNIIDLTGITWTTDSAISSYGTVIAILNDLSSDYIPVHQLGTVNIRGVDLRESRCICGYDENYTFVSPAIVVGNNTLYPSTSSTIDITIPSRVKYIRLTKHNTTSAIMLKYVSIVDSIYDGINDGINGVYSDLYDGRSGINLMPLGVYSKSTPFDPAVDMPHQTWWYGQYANVKTAFGTGGSLAGFPETLADTAYIKLSKYSTAGSGGLYIVENPNFADRAFRTTGGAVTWTKLIQKTVENSGVMITASNKAQYFTDANDAPVNQWFEITAGAEIANTPYGNGITTASGVYTGGVRSFAGYLNGLLFTYKTDGGVRTVQIFVSAENTTNKCDPSVLYFRGKYYAGRWSDWHKVSDKVATSASNIAIRKKMIAPYLDGDGNPTADEQYSDTPNPQYMADDPLIFKDFNDAPLQSVYQIDLDCDATVMANNPKPGVSSVLITTGFSYSIRHGSVQLCVGIKTGGAFAYIRYGYQNAPNDYRWTNWTDITAGVDSEDRIKWVNGRLSASGSIVSSTYSIVTSNYNYVGSAGTLFIDMPTIGILGCAYYDANYQFISRADTDNGMAAVAAGAVYARYTYQIDPTVDITPDEYGGQIHIYTDTGDVGNLLKTMLIEVPAWQAQTNYIVGDIVTVSGAYKVCKTAHTSGDQFVDTNWSNVAVWYAPGYMIGDCEIQYFAAEPNAGWSNGVIYYNTTLKRPFIVCGGTTKKYRIIPPIKNRIYIYNGIQLIYDEDKCEFEAVEHGKTFHTNEAPATLTAGYCISSTGAVTPASAYSISTPIKLAPGDKIMYSSYVGATVCAIAETDAGATKYTPIVIGDTRSGVYEYAADHEMYIAFTMASGARYTGVVESTTTVGMALNWEMPGFFSAYGSIAGPSSSVPGYAISTPVKLYAGDMVTFSCSAIANDPVMLEYQDRWNTYWANVLGNANILIMPSATGYNTYTAYVRKTAHYVFSCNSTSTNAPVLTITRPISSDAMILAYETENEWDYGQKKHNFVDKYDFVPDLTKKRTNAILAYSGDSKSNANYIVNAVAYPNGEIIAARAGGAVVKIALDGTETTLMTISNAQDWRGMFIDSNLNVYVSPHSGTFSPGVAATDRGLYRLPYGGSSFTKVISLCRSTTEIKVWATNTAYSVGDEVMRDNESDMYICSTAHTSGSTFDPTKWSAVPGWAANTHYTAGSLSKYNSRYFRCVADHTSGANFDTTKWNAATEYMANDDTIWTMCEDENGYLYAGVYSHAVRANPAVYRSIDGGSYWVYQHNFIMNGTLPESRYGNNAVRHVHCINFNEYDHCLYAAVGEVNTIVKSENHGTTWQDLKVACYYGQPTYVLGAPDGLVIGSDGHYSCGVSKLMTDGKTMKLCGRTAPGFIFNIRRSDITGWLYAWTRIDNIVAHDTQCPPPEAVDDEAVYNSWVANAPASTLRFWNLYHEWALKYYPEDARRPQNAVIMVSKDEGDTWEVINKVKVSQNYASICGYITVGYFREGECLAGLLKPIDDTESGKAFVQPVIISEGKKKHTANGYDLSGEIFIKTNTNNIVGY